MAERGARPPAESQAALWQNVTVASALNILNEDLIFPLFCREVCVCVSAPGAVLPEGSRGPAPGRSAPPRVWSWRSQAARGKKQALEGTQEAGGSVWVHAAGQAPPCAPWGAAECGMPASGRLRLWASPHPGPWRTPWVSGPLALNRGGGGACALSAGRRTTAGRTPSLPEAGVKQRRSSVASSPPPQGPSSEKRGGLGGAAAPAGNSHSTAREAPPVSIATCREEFPGLQTLSQ